MSVSRKRLVAAAAAISTVALSTVGVAAPSHAAGHTIAFVMGAEADPFFKAMKVGADAAVSYTHLTLPTILRV